MEKIILRLKSGKEFRFNCESYEIVINKGTRLLREFSCINATGECPIYFKIEDVESISVIKQGDR